MDRRELGAIISGLGWTIRPLVENCVPAGGIEHLCGLRHQNDNQHLDGSSSVLLAPATA